MPFLVHVLGLAVFAQGTSEFMLSGLVPGLARDLSVSPSTAAGLTSAYAIGMIIGAPVMALLAARGRPRPALAGFLTAFVAVHAVGALTTDVTVLYATRVAAAAANAGFLAVALPYAAALAGPTRQARATSVLLSGVTLACVVGVPAGAALGEHLGWRWVFWAVAALCLPALALLVRSAPVALAAGPGQVSGAIPDPDAGPLPGAADAGVTPSRTTSTDPAPNPADRVRRELRTFRSRPLRGTLLCAALVNGATFASFAFLALVATEVTGLPPAAVPALLAAFGAGAFAGVTVAGRASLRVPVVLGVLVPAWALFALVAAYPLALFALAALQGALSFALGTTLVSRVLRLASEAPTLSGASATVALNTGAFAGPLLAAAATAHTNDPRAALWTSTALSVVAAVLTCRHSFATRTRRTGVGR
ncbi:MFS transporter [Streptomyces sp. NPDC048717]|uniref:MFS transporter n=1 Tax=Streptomyces sp. NPDC048717 TaxID=3154928 RepID=UPI003437629C